MIEDKDVSVTLAAVGLNSQLAQVSVISESAIKDIYALISDYNGKIRYAVGDFIISYLLDHVVPINIKDSILSKSLSKEEEHKEIAKGRMLGILGLFDITNTPSNPITDSTELSSRSS